jgi:xanthosine utilization system XapX-like protein
MLILTLGFCFGILISHVVAPPLIALKGVIGQKMGQSLLVQFMGAMSPTLPSTI